jgi:hypothetical protein
MRLWLAFCFVVGLLVASMARAQAPPPMPTDSSLKQLTVMSVADTGLFSIAQLGRHDTLLVYFVELVNPKDGMYRNTPIKGKMVREPRHEYLVSQAHTRIVRFRTLFGTTIAAYEYPTYEVVRYSTGPETMFLGQPRQLFRVLERKIERMYYQSAGLERPVTPIDE